MAVDALIERLQRDASARIDELRARADAQVAAFEQARADAAANEQARSLERRRAPRQAELAAQLAVARQQAAALTLTARHALLERVFARAAQLAGEAADAPRYLASLPAQVGAALGYLGGGPLALRCCDRLAPDLARCVAGRGEVDVVADKTVPVGFVAVGGDGRCTVDATIASRLHALRPRLQSALLARVQA